MIYKILVPTDGSETANKAVSYAVGLAKQLGAKITLLSIINFDGFMAEIVSAIDSPDYLIEPIEDYLKQSAEAYLKEGEKICTKNGIQSKKVIRAGHPVEEIVNETVKSKVDLIVMGSKGRSALKAAFLGSVTFGVLHRDAKTPVLVVRK